MNLSIILCRDFKQNLNLLLYYFLFNVKFMMNHTIEFNNNIKQIFSNAGCELLSDYINRRTKVKYKCNCGNIAEIRIDSFQAGTRCRGCLSQRIKNTLVENGASEKKKANNLEKHGVEHYFKTEEFKEKSKKTLQEKYGVDNIGQVPEIIEKIKDTINKKNTIVQETEKKKYKVSLKEPIIKKEIIELTPLEKQLAGIKKYIEEKKHKIEDIRKIFEDEGCQLISTEYKDSKNKLQVIFKCGCHGEISYNHFDKGRRCNNKECMNKKKEETSMIKFGKAYYTQTEEYKKAVKETSIKKYGETHHTKTKEYLEKIKKFNLEKYGKEYLFQTDDFKEKLKKKCMDNYGLEYYSQTNLVKDKIIITNIEKYGFACSSKNNDVKQKMINTNIEKYGVQFTLSNKIIKDKANKTILDKYNVDNISQCDFIKIKKQQTSFENYGTYHPMQNIDVFTKSKHHSFNKKKYYMPSGKLVIIQGYENFMLDDLVETYSEDDIITDDFSKPEVWYFDDDGKYHRYFADAYIPKDNRVIEVKSIYTFQLDRRKIHLTKMAVYALGYEYNLIVYDKKGKKIFEF